MLSAVPRQILAKVADQIATLGSDNHGTGGSAASPSIALRKPKLASLSSSCQAIAEATPGMIQVASTTTWTVLTPGRRRRNPACRANAIRSPSTVCPATLPATKMAVASQIWDRAESARTDR